MKNAQQMFELVRSGQMSFDEFEVWFDYHVDMALQTEYENGFHDGVLAQTAETFA